MSGAVADTRFLRGLSTEFLQRHNRPGPRYTSYPTAPEWGEEVTERELRAMLRGRSAANPAAPLSLYFHIPFCEHRCSFCACNAIATPKREVVDPYLRALDQEMEIFASELAAAGADQRPVTQLHFGGGTPTFLTPPEIEWLMDRIRSHFHIGEGAEISVEIDPCVTDAAHMRTLRAQGFNRVSLGVQDFDSTTQQSIERVQTVEETRELTDLARELGFDSVNFDLVYGLPHQTPETINRSLDIILEMRPDRVALYSFAYLPKRLGHQRRIDPSALPSGPQKFEIFVTAFERFIEAGFTHIGMDHFALPDDPLSVARGDRTIQRNFMGYTTQAGTDILAMGVSSISALEDLYAQSTKRLTTHAESVARGELPIERGTVLSDEDRLRRAVIYALMCHGHLDKGEIESRFGVDFDDHFAPELSRLAPMVEDGLLTMQSDRIEVTLLGTIFVRNIGMVFDTYLSAPRAQPTYSRTL